ncbi:recombinase family protein [Arthrobacter burdickii]|uniref:Recombinase family protein n=1 Tax=Arthrobacter burdickii TaxID=3035920 RepID=A0ABT8K2Y2_9MICC|nr:recombinase family protein [Arthrobacter burdickii]MDN4611719.1 recombinase family protein [Arthrobacter burdickii]
MDTRPGLLDLKKDYEAGRFELAVADDYSRFSRDMADGASIIGSMEVATFREGIPDPEDDFSPLLFMLLSHKFSRDTGKRWNATHAHRIARRLPPNGVKQFGYDKLPDGSYVINPEKAEALRHLYSEYTRGVGAIKLVQWLAEQGITSVRGTAFTTQTLFKLLDKPFAAGYFVWAEKEYKGAHEPILTEGQWAAYKDARNNRKLNQAPRNPGWWLAGIAKCGRCGGNLVSTTIKGKQSVNCSTYNNKGKATCAGVFRKRATVDFQVQMYLVSHEEQFADAMPTDDAAYGRASKVRSASADSQHHRSLNSCTSNLSLMLRCSLRNYGAPGTSSRSTLFSSQENFEVNIHTTMASYSRHKPIAQGTPHIGTKALTESSGARCCTLFKPHTRR